MSLKEQIFASDDFERLAVEVPEWQCTLYVRGLSKDEISKLHNKTKNPLDFSVWLVIKATEDEDGKPVFDNEDFKALSQKSIKVLERLTTAALKVNKDDEEANRLEKKG